jgi:hypothetical protein
MRPRLCLCAVAAALLGAGVAVPLAPEPPPPKEGADALDGFWQSGGYGLLLEIRGPRLQAFQTTAVSCLPSWTAVRQPGTTERGEVAFRMEGQGTLRVLVTSGTAPDRKHFRIPESAASTVGFRRLDRRPDVCSRKAEDTPLANFDIFWKTFAENYPFFATRKVDWDKTRALYRPKITAETTRGQLFRTLRAMIEPLHDGHTSLQARGMVGFNGGRPDPHRLSEKDFRRVAEIIETKYARGGLRGSCNGRLGFGQLAGSVAYLRIVGFGAMTDDRDFAHGAAALEEALDAIFRESDRWRGLVVDVRVNRGGSDLNGLAVAARLATRDYLAYTKRARNDPDDSTRLTPPQASRVAVSRRPRYGGPVALLTGRHTISAGETFTMALMGRTPKVVRVGENTQGMFSDILRRDLPNGFAFGLPNEIYFAEDGKVYEGDGIPPDVAAPVFPESDLKDGKDQALDKAIDILSAPGPK